MNFDESEKAHLLYRSCTKVMFFYLCKIYYLKAVLMCVSYRISRAASASCEICDTDRRAVYHIPVADLHTAGGVALIGNQNASVRSVEHTLKKRLVTCIPHSVMILARKCKIQSELRILLFHIDNGYGRYHIKSERSACIVIGYTYVDQSLYRIPYFVRPESPSSFPDKHCFCGHKSEAPREASKYQNLIG